ncbi:hypothetical protein KIH41_16965 [Litoribacter ruber]|uniref:AbiU2 domain-containing protein n=1 Tax=Litoribacter ruber TaxID=702568 RepID=UPI001BDA4D04|nr:hypothetical protein [Litoribacter ruber]MBT0812981.1 hypothetical protein [Litoribacter ruber]
MALHLSYKSLNEITSILLHDKEFDKSIVDSETFRFYNYSLHYMFAMEVCKLMQAKNISGSANYASIKRLIGEISAFHKPNFIKIGDRLERRISELELNGIYEKIKDMRDTNLAHSDENQNGGPLSFRSFNIMEIEECRELLDDLQEIFKECTTQFDHTFIIPTNTKTQNLLKYADECRAFATKNRQDFLE